MHIRESLGILSSVCLIVAATSPAEAQTRPDSVRFVNPTTLSAPRGYSHLVEVPSGSTLLLIAGQVPLDSAGNLVGAGDFRRQAVQVFENLRRALAAGGATFRDVVKLNYYVVDAIADRRLARRARPVCEHGDATREYVG